MHCFARNNNAESHYFIMDIIPVVKCKIIINKQMNMQSVSRVQLQNKQIHHLTSLELSYSMFYMSGRRLLGLPQTHSTVPALGTWHRPRRTAPHSRSHSRPPPRSQRRGRRLPHRSLFQPRPPTGSQSHWGSCCPQTGHESRAPWSWPRRSGFLRILGICNHKIRGGQKRGTR